MDIRIKEEHALYYESKDELQRSLDALLEYCNRWKLVVNTRKTKIMIFKKVWKVAK